MSILPTGRALLDPYALLNEAGLSVDMKFADLGSGAIGHFVFPAAEVVGEDGQVFAVDILQHALEGIESRARMENMSNVSTVWGDFEKEGGVRITDHSLDVLSFVNVGPALLRTPVPVAEAARLLKTRGRCLVVDLQPNKGSMLVKREERISSDDVELLFEQNQFSTIKRFSAGPQHWGRVFQKQS